MSPRALERPLRYRLKVRRVIDLEDTDRDAQQVFRHRWSRTIAPDPRNGFDLALAKRLRRRENASRAVLSRSPPPITHPLSSYTTAFRQRWRA